MTLEEVEQICLTYPGGYSGYMSVSQMTRFINTMTGDKLTKKDIEGELSDLGFLSLRDHRKPKRTVICKKSRAFCFKDRYRLKWNPKFVDIIIRHKYGTEAMKSIGVVQLEHNFSL
jgi:hypothetical protein